MNKHLSKIVTLPAIKHIKSLKLNRIGLSSTSLMLQSQENINMIIQHAISNGVNYIDTSNYTEYGENHELEKKIAIALEQCHHQTDIKIGTTVGQINTSTYNHQSDYIFQCIENSLKCLNVESIDIYHLNGIDKHTPITESLRILNRLQEMNLIKYIGLSNITDINIIKQISSMGYTISTIRNEITFDHSITKLLPLLQYCQTNNIIFLADSSISNHNALNNNLLSSMKDILSLPSKIIPDIYQIIIFMILQLSPNIVLLPNIDDTSMLSKAIQTLEIEIGSEFDNSTHNLTKNLMNYVLNQGNNKSNKVNNNPTKEQMDQMINLVQGLPLDQMYKQIEKLPLDQVEQLINKVGGIKNLDFNQIFNKIKKK